MSHHECALLQEQLKHDVAGLQKQLASQKQSFEEEAKAHERLQEEHERELRHLKKDIKHKLVGPEPQRLLPEAQIETKEVGCHTACKTGREKRKIYALFWWSNCKPYEALCHEAL